MIKHRFLLPLLLGVFILVGCTDNPDGRYVGIFSSMLYEFRFYTGGKVVQTDLRNPENKFEGTWNTYAGNVITKIQTDDGMKLYTSYFEWTDDQNLLLKRFYLTSKEGKNGSHFLKDPAIFRKR